MNELELSNGTKIKYIDKVTALYCYREIFDDEVYNTHGITIKDGDVVFDIGANIGLFSLFVTSPKNPWKNVDIYAFEPVPQIFEVLKANLDGKDSVKKLFNIGLGEKESEIEFNYYPRCSADSTATPFDWDSKIQKYVENYKERVCRDMPVARLVPKFLRKWVVTKALKRIYEPQKVQCKIVPLSNVIDQLDLTEIHLMKVDAENAEREVFAGIRNEHWEIIKQVSMEVHTHIPGGENLLEETIELLEDKGFAVTQGEESPETQMGVYMLYATKR